MPSHSLRWQSPAIWDDVGVPVGWKLNPQVFEVQVRVWQSVSEPGHVVAATQSTQLPEPSHTWPPDWLHDVPLASAGCEGMPAAQTSLVHCEPSSAGRSPSSIALTML